MIRPQVRYFLSNLLKVFCPIRGSRNKLPQASIWSAVSHLTSLQALRNHTDNFQINLCMVCFFYLVCLLYDLPSCHILTLLEHFVIKLRVKLNQI